MREYAAGRGLVPLLTKPNQPFRREQGGATKGAPALHNQGGGAGRRSREEWGAAPLLIGGGEFI